MFAHLVRTVFAKRTRRALRFDMQRLRTRVRSAFHTSEAVSRQLHLGCGGRLVPGFLNVDVFASEHDVDLGAGVLPWRNDTFDVLVSQQVIEHLDLDSELAPLVAELLRVLRPGGEAWLACPDMEAICRSYLADGGRALFEDRVARWPAFSLHGLPPSHMVNVLFHQAGEHVNLFDFDLLSHLLRTAGFSQVTRVRESDLLKRFPGFPARNDDGLSLYVCATKA
jgi:predicted SAM-dependent methyltransferase